MEADGAAMRRLFFGYMLLFIGLALIVSTIFVPSVFEQNAFIITLACVHIGILLIIGAAWLVIIARPPH
jgi:hypothetical protein